MATIDRSAAGCDLDYNLIHCFLSPASLKRAAPELFLLGA
jgi:hypothetical protein